MPQRPPGGQGPVRGLPFDLSVARNGYAWWYLDLVSDDDEYAMTIIFFVGSVFSAAYRSARGRGSADPEQYCAVNCAVYRKRGGDRFVFTEMGATHARRSAEGMELGASSMRWRGEDLVVSIEEKTAPWRESVRGEVVLTPVVRWGQPLELDAKGRHRWTCVYPRARAEVSFERPNMRFSGNAYHDCNDGDEALEEAFSHWHWSRAEVGEGAAVLYDAVEVGGESRARGFLFDASGRRALETGPEQVLARSAWRVDRRTRADVGATASVRRTLQDTPFYARSLLDTTLCGESTLAMHESLDLRRFVRPSTQFMVPWRTRRLGD